MTRYFLVWVFFYLACAGFCYPNIVPRRYNAPECQAFQEVSNFVQDSPSPFSLQAPASASTGQVIKLRLSGGVIRKFLVRAYDMEGNSAGTFTQAPKYLSCDHVKDSATHAWTMKKYDAEMLWKAPNYVTSVTFRSLVVAHYNTTYINAPLTVNIFKETKYFGNTGKN